MRNWLGAALAGAMLCGLGYGGILVQAKDPPRGGADHASLRAYPNAVVSVTDTASGISVTVEPGGSLLTARDAQGAVLWQADVLQATGKPSEGFPVVRHLAVSGGGMLSIVVGKNRYVEADLRSGALKLLGED